MATPLPSLRVNGAAGLPPGNLRYLARQPILDRFGKAHGYELLFRSGPENVFQGNAESATRIMIDNAIVFGLRKLTGGPPAFVNCTSDAIIQKQVNILPPGMAVLEILETMDPSPELIAACRQLKTQGYKFALDDFVYKPSLKPLIEIADYIKIDWRNTPTFDRIRVVSLLKDYRKSLVAEKVETQAEFEKARTEGFTHFQGYYFCRPQLIAKRQLPGNRLVHLKLLGMLEEDPLDLRKVSEQVKLDPALTYRLLRLVNSPLCAIREEVRSIQTALMLIGDDLFRRFARMAVLSEINSGKSSELLRTAFVRARFCELAAEFFQVDAKEQYLMGLLSLLPAMLQLPMEEAIRDLPLRPTVTAALQGELGRLRYSIDWLESHERADWQRTNQIAANQGIAAEQLQDCYTKAALWADEIVATTAHD